MSAINVRRILLELVSRENEAAIPRMGMGLAIARFVPDKIRQTSGETRTGTGWREDEGRRSGAGSGQRPAGTKHGGKSRQRDISKKKRQKRKQSPPVWRERYRKQTPYPYVKNSCSKNLRPITKVPLPAPFPLPPRSLGARTSGLWLTLYTHVRAFVCINLTGAVAYALLRTGSKASAR